MKARVFHLNLVCFALLTAGCGRPDVLEAVVKDFQSGALTLSPKGAVTLPPRYASLTAKGEVFTEKKAGGRWFILFPTWYGRGADLEGVLYCSDELIASDYYTIDWGTGGKHQHIDIGGRDMLTVQDWRPHWYRVSRRLD